MEYKGYTAEIVFDEESKLLHGRVKGIKDVVTFEAEDAKNLEGEFHHSVDDYLAYCAEIGRDPEKPFSGRILLRISKDSHRKAWLAAEKLGMSLNAFIAKAIEENAAHYAKQKYTRVNTTTVVAEKRTHDYRASKED